jgi:hypothetical protein
LKGKNKNDDIKSAATALQAEFELNNKDNGILSPPSYVTLTRVPTSLHKSVKEEDSFGKLEIGPIQE